MALLVLSSSALGQNANHTIGMVREIALSSIADAYVDSTHPNENVHAGNLVTYKSEDGKDFKYTYIMFDLSSIPIGSSILFAEMRLVLLDMSGKGPFGCISIAAHHSSDSSWSDSGITWTNKPDFDDEPTDSWGFCMLSMAKEAVFTITTVAQVAHDEEQRLSMVITWASGTGSATFSKNPRIVLQHIAPPFKDLKIDSLEDSRESKDLGYVCIHLAQQYVTKSLEDFETTPCVFAVAFPQEVRANAMEYAIAYVRGYAFLKWETEGEVSVRNASSRITTLSIRGDGRLRAIGSSELIEYGYDELDSTRGKTVPSTSPLPSYMYFVQFTPIFSGYLDTVRFYFSSLSKNATRNEITVHLLDEKKSEMLDPIPVRVTYEGKWFDVRLTGHNVTVFSGTDFYVGFEAGPRSFGELNLGVDNDEPDGRSWKVVGTRWEPDTGDYMIRSFVKRADIRAATTTQAEIVTTTLSTPAASITTLLTTHVSPMKIDITTAAGLGISIVVAVVVTIFFLKRRHA